MSNYTITTNFGSKDSLPSGDPAKIIKGSEFTVEFTALETAVNSKADSNDTVLTGDTEIENLNAGTIDGGTY